MMRTHRQVRRVTEVYAFDPTLVTAYIDVPKELRESNRKMLAIDRIYERGEVLAILGSDTNFFDKPRASPPAIRQLRYNLLPRKNPIVGRFDVEVCMQVEGDQSEVTDPLESMQD